MCAEFAGWRNITGQDDKEAPDRDELFSGDFEGGEWSLPLASCDGIVHGIPHYESDPAAACSLLPTLTKTGWSRAGMAWGWLDDLADALIMNRDDEVCRLIVAAVRKVKEGET
jgi:hypothetical protein